MITMLISSSSYAETEYICRCSKAEAGRRCDEKLKIIKCAEGELCRTALSGVCTDLAYLDITENGALEEAERFRKKNKNTYLVLIAGLDLSPVTYMRPGIRAEALILKPVNAEQAKAVVREAFGELMKRRSRPDQRRVFVIDNQEGRVLIEYDSILFFESRSKKIYLCTGMKEYGFYGTLDQLQEKLKKWFVRCHRGFLVNREKIEKIVFARNMIVLEDGSEIPVSRSFRGVLKEMGKGDRDGKQGY